MRLANLHGTICAPFGRGDLPGESFKIAAVARLSTLEDVGVGLGFSVDLCVRDALGGIFDCVLGVRQSEIFDDATKMFDCVDFLFGVKAVGLGDGIRVFIRKVVEKFEIADIIGNFDRFDTVKFLELGEDGGEIDGELHG